MFAFVDLAVLGFVVGLARAGWRRGFASQAIDLAGFAVALVASIRLYRYPAAAWGWANMSRGWASLAGGLTIFIPLIVATAIVGAKVGKVARQPGLHLTNRVLGVGFGVALAAVGLTFLMLVTQVAPVPFGLANAVRRSPTAKLLLSSASPVTKMLQGVAERDAGKLVLFLRQSLRSLRQGDKPAKPTASEEPPMRFAAVDDARLRIDAANERELLRLVNVERQKAGVRPVEWDSRLSRVARAHSNDMYNRGYFAHTGLDGRSPSQRLDNAHISYLVSGENLALAPTIAMAHDGLMKSPGHRRNILDPDFAKLGIGIYAGPHGLIASQEFCGGC